MSNVATTVVVLGLAAAVLFLLQWQFHRSGARRRYAMLAASGLTLGLLLVVPGLLHTLAVTSVKLNADKPYDLRFAWLLTTGLILVCTGLAPIALTAWIRRGEPWALAIAASAATFLLAFMVILNPVAPQFGALLWLDGAWLLGLLWGLRRPARAAGAPA